jgi:hypothetical protein
MRAGSNHTKEAWSMSQEILFFLFMIVELCAILLLYQLIIIPRIALKTNNLFEERMLDKSWDIPAMLEDYTEHLATVFSEIIKTLVPQVVGGFMSAGNKQLRADPENAPQVAVADFLESLDPPARMVANMVLPRIQEALLKGKTSPTEAIVEYSPGLSKR